MAKDNVQTVTDGSFETQQTHEIRSPLEAAIVEIEATANTFAINVITDHKVRQQYMRHIKEISDQVRSEVASGNMSVKEAAAYCSQLRDKIFVEYRKYTSSVGLAFAEKLKPDPKGFDYYLNKYAQDKFRKDFSSLTTEERSAIYYTVLRKAGGGNVKVTTKVRRLQIWARVAIVFTAMLATTEVIQADDKVREIANQGSVIAGGLIGGSLAGYAVVPLCGPAAPWCALAVVFIGSSSGGWAGKEINDMYQEELPVFMHWLND